MDQKIFVEKDHEGRERRVTARNERGDFWRLELKHPDGLTKTANMHGSHSAVRTRAVQLLAEYQLDFTQAGNRGDKRPGMKPDLSVPMPADPPVGYGSYEVKR